MLKVSYCKPTKCRKNRVADFSRNVTGPVLQYMEMVRTGSLECIASYSILLFGQYLELRYCMLGMGVIPVDSEVESHELSELGIGVAEHVCEIVGPVQVGVNGSNAAAFTVQVAVNLSSDAGQLGDQIHGIFIDKLGETGG